MCHGEISVRRKNPRREGVRNREREARGEAGRGRSEARKKRGEEEAKTKEAEKVGKKRLVKA